MTPKVLQKKAAKDTVNWKNITRSRFHRTPKAIPKFSFLLWVSDCRPGSSSFTEKKRKKNRRKKKYIKFLRNHLFGKTSGREIISCKDAGRRLGISLKNEPPNDLMKLLINHTLWFWLYTSNKLSHFKGATRVLIGKRS